MRRVQTFPCALAKAEADALNRERGRVDTGTMVWHSRGTMVWHDRIYRRTGHGLCEVAAQKLEDALGGPTCLHAHRRDAAQQGCSHACNVAKRPQQMGLDLRAPHRRHCFRTTTWKHTGVRVCAGVMLRARARGLAPIRVALPANLAADPASAYNHVERVGDRAGRHEHWHVPLEDGGAPAPAPGSTSIAVDLGEPGRASPGGHDRWH
jgi:hypothetical protein